MGNLRRSAEGDSHHNCIPNGAGVGPTPTCFLQTGSNLESCHYFQTPKTQKCQLVGVSYCHGVALVMLLFLPSSTITQKAHTSFQRLFLEWSVICIACLVLSYCCHPSYPLMPLVWSLMSQNQVILCLFFLSFSEGFPIAFRIGQTLLLLKPKSVFPLTSLGAVRAGFSAAGNPMWADWAGGEGARRIWHISWQKQYFGGLLRKL